MKLLRSFLARRRLAKTLRPDLDHEARRRAQLDRPEIVAQRNARRLMLASRPQAREIFAAQLEGMRK